MGRILQGWADDVRHGARTLRRTPAFTATAVATLGLAVGVLAGIYTVLDKVLLDPLPYRDADRLVAIVATAPGSDLPEEFTVSAEFFLHYREHARQVEDMAAWQTFSSTLRVADRAERIRMAVASPSLYATLGARPALGRLPTAEDEDVMVIGDPLWRTWFGSDPDVIGRVYEAAGQRRTVVGVMPPEFTFPNDGSFLWISDYVKFDNLRPGRFGIPLLARLAPGATPESAAAELTTLARQLPARFGGSAAYARIIEQHRAVVRPVLEQMLGPAARLLWVLFAAGGIVLVIACANVANLFLVRAENRQRDLALRRAIGASRGELVRLQMAETLVVAGLAGALALALAALTLPALLQAAPARLPRLDEVAVGWPTVNFIALAALVVATACGVVPALRGSAPDLLRLRDGNRGSTSRRGWARDGLVTAQTALALVLLIGSGLLLRQLPRAQERRLRATTPPTSSPSSSRPSSRRSPTARRGRASTWPSSTALRALPGVTSAGLVENVPLNEGTRTERFRAEGTDPAPDAAPLLNVNFTAGDYFRTMGIAVLAGRTLDSADQVTSHGNVVVSESAAKTLWPGHDPVGRRLQDPDTKDWHTVVGVVEDVHQDNFREAPEAVVYFPLSGPKPDSWRITSPAYVLKTPRAEVITADVRALVREVAPEAPMYRVFTMERLAADSMLDLSFTTLVLGIVSTLALFLGAVGLYGVLSYVVAGRTREIGVRMALGASAREVRRMVVTQGARVVGAGIGLGVPAALAATRTLGSLLYGVAAVDPPIYAAMSALMLAIGLTASYMPARRASRVDPCESLRSD